MRHMIYGPLYFNHSSKLNAPSLGQSMGQTDSETDGRTTTSLNASGFASRGQKLPMPTFMVHGILHRLTHGSFARRTPTFRPSQPTWAVSLHPPSPFIVITQRESCYRFYCPQRLEGPVDLDLGTAAEYAARGTRGSRSGCRDKNK